jgi:RHS repeat-associated protein
MTTFTYDTVGRRARVEFPNGTRALYGYDAAGRLTGLTHQTSAGATLEQFRYAYNAAGERTTVTTLAQTASYGYDLVGRLTGVTAAPTGPQPSEAFTYDAVGNRLTGPTAAQGYSYNAGHQLLTGPTAQYAYDLNGNRTQKIDPLATRTYTWDAQDRLRQAVVSTAIGTATVTMAYDHRGRRVRKTVTGSSSGRSATATIDYVYDEDDIILIVTTLQVAGGLPQTTTTRVVHGPDVDEPLWLEQGGRLAVLHADGLGSIVLATDATQIVVERTTYTAFGVPARQGSAGVQPFAFTGREWDVELGLYYYRARYYDPKVGRFLSRDPLGLAAGPNPYTYVANRPTNAIDPSGANPVLWNACWEAVRRLKTAWSENCFSQHYFHGNGEPVDLIEVGLLQAMRSAWDTKNALAATQARIRELAGAIANQSCNGCDKGTKHIAFGTGRTRYERNFEFENGLYVLGHGSLWTTSTCSGTVDCGSRTCSVDCDIRVRIWDLFEDPTSTGVELAVPYEMNAEWVERWSHQERF